MRILFATGTPYLPQITGGLEVNTNELAHELMQRGHEVAVLARLSYRTWLGIRGAIASRLRPRRAVLDRDLGYSVYRARNPLGAVPEVGHPDVVVVQNGHVLTLARAFAGVGVPSVSYLHGTDFENWTVDGRQATAADLPMQGIVANSSFTAAGFARRYGIAAAVVPPIIRADRYRTPSSGRAVTFVNPVPEKGVDLVFALAARCPEIPFVLVKAWPLTVRDLLKLKARISGMPNVSLRERVSDMRTVYRETRILLMPSRCDETWGRCASEAQVSGIPVIATDRGGLPEAVGPGGIIIGRDEPVEAWVAALRALWHDQSMHKALSDAALTYAQRSQLDVGHQLDTFVDALQRVTTKRRTRIPDVEPGPPAPGVGGPCDALEPSRTHMA